LAQLATEPTPSNPCKISEIQISTKGDTADSPAVDVGNSPADPDLQSVINAWPTLPDSVRAAIRAIVAAVGKPGGK
jgi:hypothetical protein